MSNLRDNRLVTFLLVNDDRFLNIAIWEWTKICPSQAVMDFIRTALRASPHPEGGSIMDHPGCVDYVCWRLAFAQELEGLALEWLESCGVENPHTLSRRQMALTL